jgi:hypothetical protein
LTAYSNGPGLAELLRLYACGLQPRPSVQLSSSRVTANDNDYSRGSGNPEAFDFPGFRVALANELWFQDISAAYESFLQGEIRAYPSKSSFVKFLPEYESKFQLPHFCGRAPSDRNE